MPFVMTMPKLSPTMTEGVIAKWHKKAGDYVEAGDVLLEISTDKATVEHTALDPGWLKKIIKDNGDKAIVNEPLAIFTENENDSFNEQELLGSAAPQPEKATEAAPSLKTTQVIQATAPSIKTAPPASTIEQGRILASPLARKIAKEEHINLSSIQGSGPRGRIMKRDLEQVTESTPAQQMSKPLSSPTSPMSYTEEPLTSMRKVIGSRLQASKKTIPHFYIRQDIDVEALVTIREELKKREISCTINDLIVKAVACSLVKHPNVNCGFNEEKQCLMRYARVDICVAVTIPGGLITPIVTEADKRAVLDISQTVKSLATKAKENKLLPQEYQGGSFTISNLGMYGTTEFDPIINPPQGAILGIGAVRDMPVVKNSQVVPGKKMMLTLSCDHRIIDGVEAAQFMRTLKELLEYPFLMLA